MGGRGGGCCNCSQGRHLPGPGWNLKLWVWKVFLMAFYILLLKPHVSGPLKSPTQIRRTAAKVPHGAITGEASRREGEPGYCAMSQGRSWGAGAVFCPAAVYFFPLFKMHFQPDTEWHVCTSDMNILVFSYLHQMGCTMQVSVSLTIK